MPTGPQLIRVVLRVVRVVGASYWTALAALVVMTALHLRWLHRSAHAGNVLSAYGAGLVVLGLLVAARPFIRAGVRGMAVQAAQGSMPQVMGYGGPPPEAYTAHETRVDAAVPDVWAERVLAVTIVVAGTLLNGWGTPLARRWGWPV